MGAKETVTLKSAALMLNRIIPGSMLVQPAWDVLKYAQNCKKRLHADAQRDFPRQLDEATAGP
jgi:hypothetical protein